jgi:hypothetical protein
MQRNQPEAYNELANCLSAEEKATLEQNFVTAHEQWVQCKQIFERLIDINYLFRP